MSDRWALHPHLFVIGDIVPRIFLYFLSILPAGVHPHRSVRISLFGHHRATQWRKVKLKLVIRTPIEISRICGKEYRFHSSTISTTLDLTTELSKVLAGGHSILTITETLMFPLPMRDEPQTHVDCNWHEYSWDLRLPYLCLVYINIWHIFWLHEFVERMTRSQ